MSAAGRKPRPKGYGALRLISIAITLACFIVIASVAYSAFMDYRSLTSAAGTKGAGVTVGRSVRGVAETVNVTALITNTGLYALNATMSCEGTPPAGVQCTRGSVLVQPGQSKDLKFSFVIANLTTWDLSSRKLNGTVMGELVPFASVGVGFDLGQLAGQGGA